MHIKAYIHMSPLRVLVLPTPKAYGELWTPRKRGHDVDVKHNITLAELAKLKLLYNNTLWQYCMLVSAPVLVQGRMSHKPLQTTAKRVVKGRGTWCT